MAELSTISELWKLNEGIKQKHLLTKTPEVSREHGDLQHQLGAAPQKVKHTPIIWA